MVLYHGLGVIAVFHNPKLLLLDCHMLPILASSMKYHITAAAWVSVCFQTALLLTSFAISSAQITFSLVYFIIYQLLICCLPSIYFFPVATVIDLHSTLCFYFHKCFHHSLNLKSECQHVVKNWACSNPHLEKLWITFRKKKERHHTGITESILKPIKSC